MDSRTSSGTISGEKVRPELGLRSLTELSDAAAESLSKHKGGLDLRNLTRLSDAAAESLQDLPGHLALVAKLNKQPTKLSWDFTYLLDEPSKDET